MSEIDVSPVPDYLKLFRLDGKVFVVLGAGQGMGRQTAHALSQAGAKVFCVGRSLEATERVANEVNGIALLADATQRADMQRLFDQVAATSGRLDGIVDIIAMGRVDRLQDVSDDAWDWQYSNVLRHAVLALQIGAPLIAKSGGGSVTFVGSVAGILASNASIPYGTAKAALHHLARVAAVELGPSQVRVNVVAPGVTLTPRVVGYIKAGAMGNPDVLAAGQPLGRLTEPSDVAASILFLASDLARGVTGQVHVVDGGASVIAAPPLSATIGPSLPSGMK
jgi:NAD(P)-dependent dehydrogenase (short-subunit alcohol dehydrogenase family)